MGRSGSVTPSCVPLQRCESLKVPCNSPRGDHIGPWLTISLAKRGQIGAVINSCDFPAPGVKAWLGDLKSDGKRHFPMVLMAQWGEDNWSPAWEGAAGCLATLSWDMCVWGPSGCVPCTAGTESVMVQPGQQQIPAAAAGLACASFPSLNPGFLFATCNLHIPQKVSFVLWLRGSCGGLSSRMPGCRYICFWNAWEMGGWLKWQGRWEESSNFFLASLLN